MIKKDITFVFIVRILALFSIPVSTFAAYDPSTGLLPACIGSSGGCTLCDIWPLADNIINLLLFWLAIPVLTVMLIWGGVMWTTAGASPSNIEQGKKIIQSAIIGIIIAFAGWLIVDTIIKSLASGDSVIGAWQTFPKDTDCQNDLLKTEKFDFQSVVPAGSTVKNWVAYKCINKTDCDPNDITKSANFPGIYSSEASCRKETDSLYTIGEFDSSGNPNWKCVEGGVPTTPGDYYSDAEARAAFQAAGIIVKSNLCDQNQPLPPSQCPDPRPKKSGDNPGACTSLDRIPKRVLDNLKNIVEIPFYVSGGTEYGHQTHMPCAPVVDIVPGSPGNPNYDYLGTLLNAVLEAAGGITPNTRCETEDGALVESCRQSDGANHIHIKFR